MLKINSSLRILGLAVVGAVAAASQVHAQTADVIFTGTKGVTCTVRSVTPGSLATVDSTMMEGAGGLTTSGAGTAGNVVVNCTGGNSLVAVSSPVVVAAPVTPDQLQSVVEWGTEQTSAKVGTGSVSGYWDSLPSAPLLLTNAGTDQTLNVGMVIKDDVALPNGTYQYNVTVTLAAN
jgi:hypothetical protein